MTERQIDTRKDVMIITSGKCIFADVLSYQETPDQTHFDLKITKGTTHIGQVKIDNVLRHYNIEHDQVPTKTNS